MNRCRHRLPCKGIFLSASPGCGNINIDVLYQIKLHKAPTSATQTLLSLVENASRCSLNAVTPCCCFLILSTNKKKYFDQIYLKKSHCVCLRIAHDNHLLSCFLSSETDQCTHNEGEHENREPSSQHEEEPCSSDHSV